MVVETKTKTKFEQKQERKKITLKKFNIYLWVLILFSGSAYIFCVNDLSIQGFKLNEMKREIAQIDNENRNLELEIMSLKSYARLNDQAKSLSMVSSGKTEFIKIDALAVVK